MSCTCSQDTLALHVEGDLPPPLAAATAQHVERCVRCRVFVEQLRDRQRLLKTLRQQTATSTDCIDVRHRVMSAVADPRALGWALRLERAIVHALRRPVLARAALVALGIVSAAALTPRSQPPAPETAAVFEGAATLRRPEGYREWVLIGAAADTRGAHRVYIDPAGYRAFARTGTFAEGTVMIWEPASGGDERPGDPHGQRAVLLASVKDSGRFEGGWGFFDFTDGHGRAGPTAEPAPAASGCRTCHVAQADTDAVFTGSYPALRSIRQHS